MAVGRGTLKYWVSMGQNCAGLVPLEDWVVCSKLSASCYVVYGIKVASSPPVIAFGIMLAAMAGSKGGKHSQAKGKSKSNESNALYKKPEVSNSKLDLAQILIVDTYDPRDLKNKYPHPEISFSLPTSRIHARDKEELLRSGYSMAEVETTILHAGYFQGEMDLLNNILKNSIAYIEKKGVPKGEAFKDMNELCKSYSKCEWRQTKVKLFENALVEVDPASPGFFENVGIRGSMEMDG